MMPINFFPEQGKSSIRHPVSGSMVLGHPYPLKLLPVLHHLVWDHYWIARDQWMFLLCLSICYCLWRLAFPSHLLPSSALCHSLRCLTAPILLLSQACVLPCRYFAKFCLNISPFHRPLLANVEYVFRVCRSGRSTSMHPVV